MSAGTARRIENAVCTGCGCGCDDIALGVRAGRIAEAKGACEMGREWLELASDVPEAEAYVAGRRAATDEALDAAARVLAGARAPLVYGLVEASGEAQDVAVELADRLGAALDTASSIGHGPWLAAFQRRGACSATLAEVRNRADLVVLWEVAPEVSHPRFFERFIDPRGLYVAGQRVVIGLGEPDAPVSAHANRSVAIPEARTFEVLWALQAILRGRRLAAGAEQASGLATERLERFAEELRSCRYGVWVYDADRAVEPAVAEAVLALVAALNEKVAFAALGLRGHGNPAGAESVLTSRAGYPFAVDFRSGSPRFASSGYAAALLERGEVDVALLVGTGSADDLPEPARRALASIPTAVVDFRDSALARSARAAIFTATYGVAAPATVVRMDGLALRARPALDSARPSDAQVLRRLCERVVALRAGVQRKGGGPAS